MYKHLNESFSYIVHNVEAAKKKKKIIIMKKPLLTSNDEEKSLNSKCLTRTYKIQNILHELNTFYISY